jgi:hypothetical protein
LGRCWLGITTRSANSAAISRRSSV